METPTQMGTFSKLSKTVALFLAPLLALLLYLVLPDSYVNGSGQTVAITHAAKACLAILLWMALWWFTETVPIAVTALLPIVLYPLCDVNTLAKTLVPYASDTIYLFLGGFLLAAGIQRWGLDKRIALKTLQIVGTSPGAIIAGMMVATGFISMWVSNTATAAMMVPIAMAVMSVVRQSSSSPTITKGERNFGICVLLAVAYGASIGGMGTIIGSPPNGIFVRFVQQTYGIDVSIFDWMKVGMPVVLILMPLSWLLLTKVLFREQIKKIEGGKEWIKEELISLGKLSKGETVVLIVFVVTVILWCFGAQIRSFTIDGVRPFKQVSDAIIAMAAGISLFCIPVDFKRGERALDWKHCDSIPWDVLLLFGGG
ncbi:DASS family sodium-coupled anion symporter, partial [uncultured Parasutterella sp.]|uniref:SLC13 family permease n=1 Tax=uncultured Parasutterella sp. TaxID=1263098 RepID=UPI0025946688